MKTKVSQLSRNLVYLALFLIPFYFFRFSIGPLKTNIFEIGVFVAMLSACYSFLVTRSSAKFGPVWPWVFLLSALIAIFFSSDKIVALGIFKGWFLAPAILYYLIINLFDRDDLPKLTLLLYLSFTVITIWGALQSWQVIGLLFYQKNDPSLAQYLLPGNFRILGPFESPNYLAMYLAPMFFLILPVFTILKKLPRWIYFLTLVPFGLALDDIFMTGSRAGVIAVAVALIAMVIFWAKKGIKKQSYFVLAIMTLIILASTYVFLARVSSGRGESNSSRLDIYHYSIQIVKANPVLGIGLGDFQKEIAVLSEGNQQFQKDTLPYALHPHNIFLAIIINLGLLGIIAFFGILVKFAKDFWRNHRQHLFIVLGAAMLTILIQGLFDTTYFKNDLSAIFWLILAFSQIGYAETENK